MALPRRVSRIVYEISPVREMVVRPMTLSRLNAMLSVSETFDADAVRNTVPWQM
jgi:hypothetical protein